MKTYENIILQPGRIARLILNQSEKRNALSMQMMRDIIDGLSYLNADNQVVVIIISGNGKGFCAGADLSAMSKKSNILESISEKTLVKDMLLALNNIDKITISQVHGFALAGGFGLAMSCDLVIVSEDCKLGMPEIKRGLVPMNIMNPLSKVMPNKVLLELMLTGNMISPKKALEMNMINRISTIETLEKESLKMAQDIAKHSGSAIKLCKNAFYQMQNMNYMSAFSYLTSMLAVNALTDDAKEGTQAFLEKREANWTDR